MHATSRSMHYAGIGSRKTPDQMLLRLRELAAHLARLGFILDSGAAPGADSACESGCDQAHGEKRIWLPWEGFASRSVREPGVCLLSREQAASWEVHLRGVHPVWGQLKDGFKKLHLRNYGQYKDSVFVLCWTPDGCISEHSRSRETGGTGTAIALASRAGVPVFNLANPGAEEQLLNFVEGYLRGPQVYAQGDLPRADELFVFGSNLAGRHGAGTAKTALEHYGAIYGKGFGLMGQSFAIPTKDGRNRASLADPKQTLSLAEIAAYVRGFTRFAATNLDKRFFVVPVGCGLAGYTPAQIAPLFLQASRLPNCRWPKAWLDFFSVASPVQLAAPINIYSGEKGLGGGLTNPTDLARQKGNIKHPYPITLDGVNYLDAEAAYHALAAPRLSAAPATVRAYNDTLMAQIIAAKFLQHPKLQDLVLQRGGELWLERCNHIVGGEFDGAWTGYGLQSRFIRNLVAGWRLSRLEEPSLTPEPAPGQLALL